MATDATPLSFSPHSPPFFPGNVPDHYLPPEVDSDPMGLWQPTHIPAELHQGLCGTGNEEENGDDGHIGVKNLTESMYVSPGSPPSPP